MYTAPTLSLEVDLDLVFIYEILLDNCPTAILKALESLPINDILTITTTITTTTPTTTTLSGI